MGNPEPTHDEGFESMVRELERPIGQFLAQMTADRALAADLMQESFLAAWRDRRQMPANPALRRGWLYGIARNRALSALRKRRRGLHAWGRLADRAEASVLSAEQDDALAMRDLLVRTLGPGERSLFVLRHVHGFDGPELARLTGLKPDAMRKRLQRAAERMAGAYAAASHEQERHHADVCI